MFIHFVFNTTREHTKMADHREVNSMEQAKDILLVFLEFLWMWIQVFGSTVKALFDFVFPPIPKDVAGEIVLITGAGHGMGREMAIKFANLSAIVVCVDINAAGNEETVNRIKENNGKAYRYECDVTNRGQVMEMAEKVKKDVGTVTMLINNAGIMPCRKLLDHSEREISATLDVNVKAHFWMLQAFLPGMMKKNHGHIAAMSSVCGLMGIANTVPYCASKFAVRGIMEALQVELRQDPKDYSGINLTIIYPYIVNTGLAEKPRIRFQALMKVLEPSEVADQIIDAVRRNYFEITVPSDIYYTNKYVRILPTVAGKYIQDFAGTGLEPHD